MTIESFPLHWPHGWPRSSSPERSRFGVTSQDRVQKELMNEIRLLGGQNVILSTNLELRRDGLPYTKQVRMNDPGVAVYFTLKGQQKCFACDRWDRLTDNLRSIQKTIEALRGIERWGSSKMVEQAFQGFTALPSNEKPKRLWYDVLKVHRDSSYEVCEQQFKTLSLLHHPDRGGSAEQMAELNEARKEMREYHNKN